MLDDTHILQKKFQFNHLQFDRSGLPVDLFPLFSRLNCPDPYNSINSTLDKIPDRMDLISWNTSSIRPLFSGNLLAPVEEIIMQPLFYVFSLKKAAFIRTVNVFFKITIF